MLCPLNFLQAKILFILFCGILSWPPTSYEGTNLFYPLLCTWSIMTNCRRYNFLYTSPIFLRQLASIAVTVLEYSPTPPKVVEENCCIEMRGCYQSPRKWYSVKIMIIRHSLYLPTKMTILLNNSIKLPEAPWSNMKPDFWESWTLCCSKGKNMTHVAFELRKSWMADFCKRQQLLWCKILHFLVNWNSHMLLFNLLIISQFHVSKII